jgi:hypothetical protein
MVTTLLVLGMLLAGGQAQAQGTAPSASPPPLPKQYVFPAKGQTPEVQKQDEAGCHAWAIQQTGFDPAHPPAPPAPKAAPTPPPGAGLKSAARGAAAGYIIGDLANDEGGEGAAIGAVVGASRARRKQAAAQQQVQQQNTAEQQQHAQKVQQMQGEFLKARTACLEAKGYTVK